MINNSLFVLCQHKMSTKSVRRNAEEEKSSKKKKVEVVEESEV